MKKIKNKIRRYFLRFIFWLIGNKYDNTESFHDTENYSIDSKIELKNIENFYINNKYFKFSKTFFVLSVLIFLLFSIFFSFFIEKEFIYILVFFIYMFLMESILKKIIKSLKSKDGYIYKIIEEDFDPYMQEVSDKKNREKNKKF